MSRPAIRRCPLYARCGCRTWSSTRLLQPFARRDLIPDRMWSHRSGEMLHVEIAMAAMPAEIVHLVEGNLRQVVGVRSLTQVRPEEIRQAA